MQKLNEKKILGTVPKKLQLVETFWDCPEFSKNKQNQKGITLIALIITIIVMLILVGVTITVALNGGLFSKVEEATTKTKIAQIQEALTLKRAEVLAEHNGKTPTDYGITISNLDIPGELKTEYGSKLKISKDGKLYYNASTVTNAEEQNQFKSMGIEEYVETNTGTLDNFYEFTIAEIMQKGSDAVDTTRVIPVQEFWPEDVSDELKNSKIVRTMNGYEFTTYNVICLDSKYSNVFDLENQIEPPNSFSIIELNGLIYVTVLKEDTNCIMIDNYENYADLTFRITMAE